MIPEEKRAPLMETFKKQTPFLLFSSTHYKRLGNSIYICSTMDFPTCCIRNTFKGLVCAQLSFSPAALQSLFKAGPFSCRPRCPGSSLVPGVFPQCWIEKQQNVTVKIWRINYMLVLSRQKYIQIGCCVLFIISCGFDEY